MQYVILKAHYREIKQFFIWIITSTKLQDESKNLQASTAPTSLAYPGPDPYLVHLWSSHEYIEKYRPLWEKRRLLGRVLERSDDPAWQPIAYKARRHWRE